MRAALIIAFGPVGLPDGCHARSRKSSLLTSHPICRNDFRHENSDLQTIPWSRRWAGGKLALLDYDNDGRLDSSSPWGED